MDYFGEEIKHFDVVEKKPLQESTDFDTKMLGELIEMLGVKFVQDNLTLFEQAMSGYVIELQQAYQVYKKAPEQQAELLSTSHKIKGALASVGLKRLQQIAALAQNGDAENWQGNIAHWVDILVQEWQLDVNKLRLWLSEM